MAGALSSHVLDFSYWADLATKCPEGIEAELTGHGLDDESLFGRER